MSRRYLPVVSVLALALALAACSSEEPEQDTERIVLTPASGEGAEGHTHAPGQGHGAPPVGDGVRARAGGYAMTDVTLPDADGPGAMSFRITDAAGEPVTEYVEEQTKLLHLYVVRADLSAFRHLHPTLDDDGTWRARVDLGEPGPWRVVAELQPKGADRAVVLGTQQRVPGKWQRVAVPRGEDAAVADDGVVRVRLLDTGRVGDNGRIRLAVTDVDGRPLTLGSYLGAAAHVTGFRVDTGAESSGGFVHVHPYGAPEVTDDATILTFHTTFTRPGDYRTFVQVRVDGLLHQVPITVPVTD